VYGALPQSGKKSLETFSSVWYFRFWQAKC